VKRGGEAPRRAKARTDASANGVPTLASMHPSAARWIGALIRMASPHPSMTQILDVVERLQDRPYRTNCVLLGEPGTGKEGLARALHHLMAPDTPLVRVDLGGYDDDEALAVLAAVTAGTPAKSPRPGPKGAVGGARPAAAAGVLLVEEVANLSARVQTALLRLLKGGAATPPPREAVAGAGGGPPPGPRINVIALSERDLAAEVAAGHFRHDLYFALARIVLTLPPLRERMQDLGPASVWIGNRILRAAGGGLEVMTAEELERAPAAERAKAIELHPGAIAALSHHAWPGNFRELEVVLERALMLHRNGATVGAAEIEAALAGPGRAPPSAV
jgi:DNA-binding NtrC family response regulator